MYPGSTKDLMERVVNPALTKESKLAQGVQIPCEDGTFSIALSGPRVDGVPTLVDIRDDAELGKCSVTSVKETAKGKFATRSQTASRLNPDKAKTQVIALLEHIATMEAPVSGN